MELGFFLLLDSLNLGFFNKSNRKKKTGQMPGLAR